MQQKRKLSAVVLRVASAAVGLVLFAGNASADEWDIYRNVIVDTMTATDSYDLPAGPTAELSVVDEVDGHVANRATAWTRGFEYGPLGTRVLAESDGTVTEGDNNWLLSAAWVGGDYLYRVESDTLAAGTTVDLTIGLHVSGTIRMMRTDGGDFLSGSSVNSYTFFDLTLDAESAGEGAVEQELFWGIVEIDPEDEGVSTLQTDFDDAFNVTANSGGHYEATIDHVFDVNLTGVVGEDLYVYLNLATQAGNDATLAMLTDADFLGTTSFTISAAPGVDARVSAVPEPAALAMLVGLPAMLLRRRGQVRAN